MTNMEARKTLALELDSQISEVKRELNMRKTVYKRMVEAGKITQMQADKQFGDLESALSTLNSVRRIYDNG